MRISFNLVFLVCLAGIAAATDICDVFQIHTALFIHFDDAETGWELSCDGKNVWSVPLGSVSEAPGSWASYTACIDDTAECYLQIAGDCAGTGARPGSHFNLRYGDETIQEGRLPNDLITICLGIGCDDASYPTRAPRAAVVPTPTNNDNVSADSSTAVLPLSQQAPTPAPTPVTPTHGPHMQRLPTKGPTESPARTTAEPPVYRLPPEPTLGTSPPSVLASVSNAPVSNAPVSNAPVSKAPVSKAPVSNSPVSNAPVSNSPVTNAPVSKAPVTVPPPVLITNRPTRQPVPTPLTQNNLPPEAVLFTRSPAASPVSAQPISAAPVSVTPTTGVSSVAPVVSSMAPAVSSETPTTAVVDLPTTSDGQHMSNDDGQVVMATMTPSLTPTASPLLMSPTTMTTTETNVPVTTSPSQAPTSSVTNVPRSGDQPNNNGDSVSAATDTEDEGLDETSKKFWRRRLTYIILGIVALCVNCLCLLRCLCLRSRRRKALQQRDRLDFEDARLPSDMEIQRTWSPRSAPVDVYR